MLFFTFFYGGSYVVNFKSQHHQFCAPRTAVNTVVCFIIFGHILFLRCLLLNAKNYADDSGPERRRYYNQLALSVLPLPANLKATVAWDQINFFFCGCQRGGGRVDDDEDVTAVKMISRRVMCISSGGRLDEMKEALLVTSSNRPKAHVGEGGKSGYKVFFYIL